MKGAASPYATGGGGVVLEHAYGAVLLAALLRQGPVRGLGDEVTPVEVRFQQAASYPVDDVVVVGLCGTGERRMFVSVRRNPTIGAGSAPFVDLLAAYVRMVVGHRVEFDAGRWRLALAVAAPHTPSAEVATLAWHARKHRSHAEFRAAVNAPQATRAKLRERLRTLDAAVEVAAGLAGVDPGGNELTWHMLRALRIIHLALEGDDPADRSRTVGDLMPLAGGVAQASDLWRQLVELSAGYAQAAATVDLPLLLRDLSTRLDPGPQGRIDHVVNGPAVRASSVGGQGSRGGRISTVPGFAEHVVQRQQELDAIVQQVCAEHLEPVVALTAVTGTGGFGKTTLAKLAGRDPRIQQRFPEGTLWVELGEQVRGAELASKINDVSCLVSGERPSLVDPQQAGAHLGQLLSRGRWLLIIDDVWQQSQLSPFLFEAPGCVRLVTTRDRDTLPRGAAVVTVDAMNTDQARELLTDSLAVDPAVDMWGLLGRTGAWPVLLRLVNGFLRSRVHTYGMSLRQAVAELEGLLAVAGPTGLDITSRDQRDAAVSATVQASLRVLEHRRPGWSRRYLELAVFPEDADIPLATLARYWSYTSDLSQWQAQQLCSELAALSLVQDYRPGAAPAVLRLHDVIRSYLHHQAGDDLPGLHQALLEAHRPAGSAQSATAWWEVDGEAYLWPQLTYHLQQAGLTDELDTLACDLRWITAVLQRQGPAAVETDLERATTGLARVLQRAITQNAHVLMPMNPPHALAATLVSRLSGYPALIEHVRSYATGLHRPHLAPAWPLPDLPHPATRRVLGDHAGWVAGVAISPDGTWLATINGDDVWLWDVESTEYWVLEGHTRTVEGVAISPDGTWLATTSMDKTVRLWDADDCTELAVLKGHKGWVQGVAISPDGTWLATGDDKGKVRLWDADDGTRLAVLKGHHGQVTTVAISPDGTWLATADTSGMVMLWDAQGNELAALEGHNSAANGMAISPDGTWLATADSDGMVRLWDTHGTPRLVTTLAGHTDWVSGVAISPDGTWLATSSGDRTVRLWDTQGTELAVLAGHTDLVTGVAISPDGTWLASASWDETARLWDAQGASHAVARGCANSVIEVAVSPDGTWLATAESDDMVRLWDAQGTELAVLAGHTDSLTGVAVSPDGTWLATTSGHNRDDGDHSVRLWNADGTPRAILPGLTGALGVAISPDGTWFATDSGEYGDHTVRLWSADGTPRVVLGGADRVAISPDGSWLATYDKNDKTVRLWNNQGTELGVLEGHTRPVQDVAISPDGTWLATTSYDKTVRLWDVRGTELAVLNGYIDDPSLGRISMTISPDGTWFATTGGRDYRGAVRLWNTQGSELAVLEGHTRIYVNAPAISSDGTWMATTCGDGIVRIWDVKSGTSVTALGLVGHLKPPVWAPDSARLYIAGAAGLYVLQIHF